MSKLACTCLILPFFLFLPHLTLFLLFITFLRTLIWHYRLGHLSDERLRVLRTQYPFISSEKIHLCDICNSAKQKKLPFTLSTSKTAVVFYLIHMDIWGPCSINSMQGFRYFLTVVDDFSRYTWIFPLTCKIRS